MKPELGRKICDGPRPQNTSMPCTPGSLSLLIFPQAPVRVVDAAVQGEFSGSRLQLGEWKLRQQGNRIVIKSAPAYGIEIKEQPHRVMVPTPPQVARQSPEPFLRGSNETIERARFAYDRGDLGRRFAQHANFVFREDPWRHGLDNQNAL